MVRFYCESCNAEREDDVCSNCGRDTRRIEDGSPIAASAAPPPPPRVVLPPVSPSYAPPPAVALPPSHRDNDVPATPPHSAPTFGSLDEFHALLDRGMEAIIICGGSRTGKSEIAAGFIRANNVYRGKAQFLTLRAPLRTAYALGGTTEEVWYQIVDDKRVFLDPSGEFFLNLSADYRRGLGLPEITEADFGFVQRAVRQLAGIVLVMDLTRVTDDRDFRSWRQQENEFDFVLPALRWLRFDKEARPDAINARNNIAQRVAALPLLDLPVLVLFSKADQLTNYVNLTPLDFARQRLPILHGALMTHAKRFRYDFCHTMRNTPDGDREVDNPCGVLMPMEWLLHNRFRWLPFQLPTRSWLVGGGK